jgi:hypothetical protein
MIEDNKTLKMTTQIDHRLIWLYNNYAYYYNSSLIGNLSQEEFQQKVEGIENECRAIWGTVDQFYQFLNERKVEGQHLTEEMPR